MRLRWVLAPLICILPLLLSGPCNLAAAALVRVVDIDPTRDGGCPTSLNMELGPSGVRVCVRSSFPVSSAFFDAAAAMNATGDLKGLRVYARLNGTLEVYQKGSMEAFGGTTRDSSSIESSNYVDGISITVGTTPRDHVFTLALGLTYDTTLSNSGLCPCFAGNLAQVCGGTNPPAWLVGDVLCDSGFLGFPSSDWGVRGMTASFDVGLVGSLRPDDIEVRLMGDQLPLNENVGVASLQIDVHEEEDVDHPVLRLAGATYMEVRVDDAFSDPGVTCIDAIDGVLTPTVDTVVDTTIAGMYLLTYRCEDRRQNVGTMLRTVRVLDADPPQISVRAGSQQCVVQGLPYAEYGADCTDAVDGHFMANVTGEIDTDVTGSYVMTYICTDSSGNTVTATSTVLVVTNEMPGDLVIERIELQTSAGFWTAVGARSAPGNVDPKTDFRIHWSGAFSLGTEGCRFLTIFESIGSDWFVARRYEGISVDPSESISGQRLTIAQGTNPMLSAGLKDLATYRVVVDPHFIQGSFHAGNLRQVFSFTTGDFSAPTIALLDPAPDALSVSLSHEIVLTFNEDIRRGTDANVRVLNVAHGIETAMPCNGTTLSGASLHLRDRSTVLKLQGWSGWHACTDYRVDVDAGCVVDASPSANPSLQLSGYRFITSCVVGLDPSNGSSEVPMASPIVITFASAVQVGTGAVYLRPLGELEHSVSAQDFPMVFADSSTLTIDQACATKTCAVRSSMAAAGNASALGLCRGWELDRCRGKPFLVRLGAGTIRWASNYTWSPASLLNGTDALPAQLDVGEYQFVVKPLDYTPPVIGSVDVAATSETTLRATVRIDESGTVYCAALGSTYADLCTSMTLVEESSPPGRCGSNSSIHGNNSYGCYDMTVVWVDLGCGGTFDLGGHQIECQSREDEVNLYDGGASSILSLGHRHACAVRKTDSAPSCWGRADYIDPSTGDAPAGLSLSSLAAGWMHTCGVQTGTGGIVCWGHNSVGELDGPASPSHVMMSVSSGYQFSCGIHAGSAEAECWGLDDEGQASPPSGVRFSSLSLGFRHACGIREKDSLAECWGMNDLGQSGPPASVALGAKTPGGQILVEAGISAGWFHTCGIRAVDAGLECWGSNSHGQTDAPHGLGFVQVAAGHAHTCGLLRQPTGRQARPEDVNGTVLCWGLNDHGQASPPASMKFSAIGVDDDYTCGITLANETLFCWGKDDYGQATPPDSSVPFGLPDRFVRATCALDSAPTKQRISAQDGWREAGALLAVVYDASRGYAEAVVYLNGLVGGSTYDVYCYAEDDELPIPNVVSDRQMLSTKRSVTMLDRTPPSMQIRSVSSSRDDTITVTLHLSEPGVVYCAAIRDGERALSGEEIIALGSRNVTNAVLLTSVTIAGLPRDTEFNTYCTAHDNAAVHQDANRIDNWMLQEAVLQTKRDAHTLYDTTPPLVAEHSPPTGSLAGCLPDGVDLGCKTTVSLTFNEDIQRGDGNVSLVCLSNFGVCSDLVFPLLDPTFPGGSTFVENRRLDLVFDVALPDQSKYQVVVGEGAVADLHGNTFQMDVRCEPWFNEAQWQTSVSGPYCVPVYTFETPT